MRRIAVVLLYALAVCMAGPLQTARADAVDDALERAIEAGKRGDFATAKAIYEKLDAQGVPLAALYLGTMYTLGVGVEVDKKHGCDLYERAAKADLAQGQHVYGDCFFQGAGRPQDYKQSLFWYRKAAAQNFAAAFCAIGNHYFAGHGVAKDSKKGLALCLKGARMGSPDAQTDVGTHYLGGIDVPRSYKKAAYWLTKAADQGQPNAALELGTMYWNGDGVARSENKAVHYFHVAAHGRNARAPFYLGRYYYWKGRKADASRVDPKLGIEAGFWLYIASRVDPSRDAREEARKLLVQMLQASPDLKPKIEERLGGKPQ